MADVLPEFVVLRFEKYVCFECESEEGGFVNCGAESVFDPYAKIQVEKSKTNSKYVHLRFCASNKYWTRPNLWIEARSNQPEEDISKPSCTLFFVTDSDDGLIRINHAPSGHNVCMDWTTRRLESKYWISQTWFSVVDWASLTKLPKRVAFKQGNDEKKDYKFVEDVTQDGLPYLKVGSEDGNRGTTAFEVHMQPDGHLRIMSVYHNKFWRRSPNWIWSDSEDQTGNDKDTLFWPVKVDHKTVALRNAGNNYFIRPLSVDGKENCLNAASSTMTNDTKFIVEELVLERSVYNVRYRMEDARILDEAPFVAGVANARNTTDTESTMTVTVKFEENTSVTFSNSVEIKAGIKVEFKAGFAFIVEEKIETSLEVTFKHEWNEAKGSSKSVEASYTLTVPAKSVAHVSYVGTRGTCNVPFSYTQRDKSSTDGQIITSEHIDGIFNGVSCYNYHFEQTGLLAL